MKGFNAFIKKFISNFCRIKLVDRFLIIIMIILFLQSIIGLFTPFGDPGITDRIDVVMRTTMSSIFGYFVSSNFLKGINQNDLTQDDVKEQKKKEKEEYHQKNLQIMIVGAVCVFSVILLFSIRYFAHENNDSLAFIFLFRDFVCSSIGFLIGMPCEQDFGN